MLSVINKRVVFVLILTMHVIVNKTTFNSVQAHASIASGMFTNGNLRAHKFTDKNKVQIACIFDKPEKDVLLKET